MIRFPMIYFIVVVHTPKIVGYANEPTIPTFIGSFVTVIAFVSDV